MRAPTAVWGAGRELWVDGSPPGAQQHQGSSGHLIPHGDRQTDSDWWPQRSPEPCSLCRPTITDVQCHVSVHTPGLGVASTKRRKEWIVKTGTIYIYTLLSVQFQTTVAGGYRYDCGGLCTTTRSPRTHAPTQHRWPWPLTYTFSCL